MRLTLFEINQIITLKNEIFGVDSEIYLFGSRVDDSAKGGDIDLYIKTKCKTNLLNKKIKFIVNLENKIGEQKIDIVFSKNNNRLIEIEAKKGIKLDLQQIKLEKYFKECDKHLQRIEEAYEDMKDIFPLTVEKYQSLTKDKVQAIDQYLFRFSKLQDTIGDKIFKLIIRIYDENSDSLPFIDKLNKLEKIGFLYSAKEWINLRKIRNEIAHKYDDEAEEMTLAMNNIVNQKNIIKNIYSNLKQKSNPLYK